MTKSRRAFSPMTTMWLSKLPKPLEKFCQEKETHPLVIFSRKIMFWTLFTQLFFFHRFLDWNWNCTQIGDIFVHYHAESWGHECYAIWGRMGLDQYCFWKLDANESCRWGWCCLSFHQTFVFWGNLIFLQKKMPNHYAPENFKMWS